MKKMKHWLELEINSIENLSIENSSNKLVKNLKIKIQVEKHAHLVKSIFKIKNSMVFYIDGANNSKTTDAAIVQFFNAETKAKNWNLDKYIDIIEAKLFAIAKVIEFCANKVYSMKITSNISIFTNYANAITRLEKFDEKTASKLQRIIWNRS